MVLIVADQGLVDLDPVELGIQAVELVDEAEELAMDEATEPRDLDSRPGRAAAKWET